MKNLLSSLNVSNKPNPEIELQACLWLGQSMHPKTPA